MCVSACVYLSVYFWRVKFYVLFGMECEYLFLFFFFFVSIRISPSSAAVEKVPFTAPIAVNGDSSSCCLYTYIFARFCQFCFFFALFLLCNELWNSFVTKLKIMPDICGDILHLIIRNGARCFREWSTYRQVRRSRKIIYGNHLLGKLHLKLKLSRIKQSLILFSTKTNSICPSKLENGS